MPVRESGSIIVKMIDEKKFDSILHNYVSSAWDRFLKFGIISSAFIGFMIIWQFIKYCVDVMIRGVTLHRIYEFSIHLLAALWSTVTHFVLIFRPLPVQQQNDVENQANEIINEGTPLQANPRNEEVELEGQEHHSTQNRGCERVELDYS